jgi:hypothetical protein
MPPLPLRFSGRKPASSGKSSGKGAGEASRKSAGKGRGSAGDPYERQGLHPLGKGSVNPLPVYIGVDPGAKGGMVALYGEEVELFKLEGTSEKERWEWISRWEGRAVAVIERQEPRPTFWQDKGGAARSSVLKSTVLLYGNYSQLRGFLVAANIRFEDPRPGTWQKVLGAGNRKKGEKQAAWKGRLKQRAEQLFPSQKVTLAVSDALLLAEYGRRVLGGKNEG